MGWTVPPTIFRKRCAAWMTLAGPTSSEPAGAPRPLDKQKDILHTTTQQLTTGVTSSRFDHSGGYNLLTGPALPRNNEPFAPGIAPGARQSNKELKAPQVRTL